MWILEDSDIYLWKIKTVHSLRLVKNLGVGWNAPSLKWNKTCCGMEKLGWLVCCLVCPAVPGSSVWSEALARQNTASPAQAGPATHVLLHTETLSDLRFRLSRHGFNVIFQTTWWFSGSKCSRRVGLKSIFSDLSSVTWNTKNVW
jgi:hypothetical protein